MCCIDLSLSPSPKEFFGCFNLKTSLSESSFFWTSLAPGGASQFALVRKARSYWGLRRSLFGLELFCVKIFCFLERYHPTRPFSLCTVGEVKYRRLFLSCPTSWVCFPSGSVPRPGLQLVTQPGPWCVLTRPPPAWRISWPAPAPSAPW